MALRHIDVLLSDCMPITEKRSDQIARLNFRLPPEAKSKIESAALAEGLTVTDFAIHALVDVADQVLERHHSRRLTDRDRDAFLALLDSDDDPNPALVDAFRSHQELVRR